MKRTVERTPRPVASGYAMPLGDGITAYAHADGALTLESADGGALDLSPVATAAVAELLGMSGQLRAAARRRLARAVYHERWEVQDA